MIYAVNRGRMMGDAYVGMDWLVSSGKRKTPTVVTMSFGAISNSDLSLQAMNALVDAGVTVTVSAGNNNFDACQRTWAFIPSAITVGSTTSTNSRSTFSNYGECVDILAPGSSTLSADYQSDTGSTYKSGTSMATPHVAGAVALILQASPSSSPARVRERLIRQAKRDVITDVKGSPNLFLQVEVSNGPNPTPSPQPTPAPPVEPTPTPSPPAPTPAPPTGACEHEKDCDVSAWCRDTSFEAWCRLQGQSNHCPAPYCTWASN